MRYFWVFLFLGSLSTVLFGQISVSERLKLLREKSKSHQSYIASILAGSSISKTTLKVEPDKPPTDFSRNSYGVDSLDQNAADLPQVILPDPKFSEVDRSFDSSIDELPLMPQASDTSSAIKHLSLIHI